jgi:hypothetical protein
MSGVATAVGIWSTDKIVALTAHSKRGHLPSPIAPQFVAPATVANLFFGPIALAAAVARTATTRDDAPPARLDALQRSTLPLLEIARAFPVEGRTSPPPKPTPEEMAEKGKLIAALLPKYRTEMVKM